MAAKLANSGVGSVYTWNIDRYIKATNDAYIQDKDIVLLWQPHLENAPAGIYACGCVSKEPFWSPNPKSNWRTEVTITQVLTTPVYAECIRAVENADLQALQIFKMANHIVFRVTSTQWQGLQNLNSAFIE